MPFSSFTRATGLPKAVSLKARKESCRRLPARITTARSLAAPLGAMVWAAAALVEEVRTKNGSSGLLAFSACSCGLIGALDCCALNEMLALS